MPSLTELMAGRFKMPVAYLLTKLFHVREVKRKGNSNEDYVIVVIRQTHHMHEGYGHGHGSQTVTAMVDNHSESRAVSRLSRLFPITIVKNLINEQCMPTW